MKSRLLHPRGIYVFFTIFLIKQIFWNQVWSTSSACHRNICISVFGAMFLYVFSQSLHSALWPPAWYIYIYISFATGFRSSFLQRISVFGQFFKIFISFIFIIFNHLKSRFLDPRGIHVFFFTMFEFNLVFFNYFKLVTNFLGSSLMYVCLLVTEGFS